MDDGVDVEFRTLVSTLATRLERAAKEFFTEAGLDEHKSGAWCKHQHCGSGCADGCWQKQMTTPLRQMARELLMFGGDRWPHSAFENVVALPCPHGCECGPASQVA